MCLAGCQDMRRASWDPLLSNKRSMVHIGRQGRRGGVQRAQGGWLDMGSCVLVAWRRQEVGWARTGHEVGLDLAQRLFWLTPHAGFTTPGLIHTHLSGFSSHCFIHTHICLRGCTVTPHCGQKRVHTIYLGNQSLQHLTPYPSLA